MWGWREGKEERKEEGRKGETERRKRSIFFFHWLAQHREGGLWCWQGAGWHKCPLTLSRVQSLQLIGSLLLHSFAQSLHESSLISDGVILGEEERRITYITLHASIFPPVPTL